MPNDAHCDDEISRVLPPESHCDDETPRVLPTEYSVGTTLRIHKHTPPDPFSYGPNRRPKFDWNAWYKKEKKHWFELDRIQFALDYPPIETHPQRELERTITITGSKTRWRRGGAHVLTCFIDGHHSEEYVAKIYDGVYYPMDPRRIGEYDCMTTADLDYSVETLAYNLMQPELGGQVVPGYHGAWTFALDTDRPGQQRWVRMILIDLVEGECMVDIIDRAGGTRLEGPDYSLLPPEEFRLRILQNIFEAETAIYWHAGVFHLDLKPRNIIIKPNGKVVIVDFDQVEYNNCKYYAMKKGERYARLAESPLERFWSSVTDRVGIWRRWLPESWLENEDLGKEWLIHTFGDSAKYKPLSKHFLDCRYRVNRCSPRILQLLEGLRRKPAGAVLAAGKQ